MPITERGVEAGDVEVRVVNRRARPVAAAWSASGGIRAHWVTVAATGLLVTWAATTRGIDADGASAFLVAMTVFAALIVAYTLALLLGRSSVIFNGLFCAIVMLPMVGQEGLRAVAEARTGRAQAESMLERVAAQNREELQEMLRELEQGGEAAFEMEADLKRIERTRESLAAIGEAGGRVGGTDGAALEAIAVIGQEVADAGERYTRAVEAFVRAGGLEIDAGVTRQDLRGRIELVKRVAAANREVERLVVRAPGRFRSEVEARGVKAADSAAMVRTFRDTAKLDMLMAFRQSQANFAEAAEQTLAFLVERWGAWSVDGETGELVFGSVADSEAFEELSRRLEMAVRQEEAAMRRYLQAMR